MMVHAINSRRKNVVIEVLEHGENIPVTDQTDPSNKIFKVSILICFQTYIKYTWQNAVLNSTLNDDPETLKAILDWGNQKKIRVT